MIRACGVSRRHGFEIERREYMARRMTRCALFGALLCLISPICIPIGPIPISLAVFAVMLIAQVLPRYEALTVVCLYLVLGALGLPVFAGFSGSYKTIFHIQIF
jgi:biotin transport system substrate-specific component